MDKHRRNDKAKKKLWVVSQEQLLGVLIRADHRGSQMQGRQEWQLRPWVKTELTDSSQCR